MWWLAQGRRTAEIENAVAIGETVATFINQFARDLEATTLAVSRTADFNDAPLTQETVGADLNALQISYRGLIRAIFLTDLDGRVIATPSGTQIGLDLAGCAFSGCRPRADAACRCDEDNEGCRGRA